MSLWSAFKSLFTGRSDSRIVAPIISEPQLRGFENEFRLPNDPPYAIRINQRSPKGLPSRLAEFVAVAGTAQADVRVHAEAFIAGSGRSIELTRLPDHPFDPNAVAVIGRWSDAGGEHCERLGYLPAEIAAKIARVHPETPIGATIKILYASDSRRNPGIRLDLWIPRRKRPKAD